MLKKNLSNISKKSKMIAATAFVLGATAIGGGVAVYAAEAKDDFGPMNELVATIAEKFGLNKDEVQTVVDEVMETQREEMETKHQEEFIQRLGDAVSKGKVTQDQADSIADKFEDMRALMEQNREEHKNLSADERKEQMEKNKTELEQWAEDNNLTKDQLQYLHAGRGFGGAEKFGPRFED